MKYLLLIILFIAYHYSNAQSPQLIFNSGFEPSTDTILQSSTNADLIGIDNSVAPPNNWISDLDSNPLIGNFNIQYQGGDSTQRLAELVQDPLNPFNTVLKYWISEPNVLGEKGRVQANLYGNPSGLTNVFYKIKLLLPSDLDTLKELPTALGWFTLMEFWNNPGWIDSTHGFRVTVNLYKPTATVDSFYLNVHGQIYNPLTSNYDSTVWEYYNPTFYVPTNQWIDLDINFIEGDSTNGRFYLAATPEGESKIEVFDLTEFTHHPSDPAPDGLSHFNPFKLYTSDVLIDSLTNWGKLCQVHWDDFELWTDSMAIANVDSKFDDQIHVIYPNPCTSYFNISSNFSIGQPYSANIYSTDGRLIKGVSFIGAENVIINIRELESGNYVVNVLNSEEQIIINKKISVK